MSANTLYIHIEFAEYIREWVDTPYSLGGMDGKTPMVKVGQEATPHSSAKEAAFAVQLSSRLYPMFEETIKAGGGHGFKDVFISIYPDRESIRDVDLVCYMRQSRAKSLLSTEDLKRWAPPKASGVTQLTGNGVHCEVWFEECGRNIGAVANVMYHEFMHAKTRFSHNEDAGWVHGPEGGGGLASSETWNAVAQLTMANKMVMAQRLAIRNRQDVSSIPARPEFRIRR